SLFWLPEHGRVSLPRSIIGTVCVRLRISVGFRVRVGCRVSTIGRVYVRSWVLAGSIVVRVGILVRPLAYVTLVTASRLARVVTVGRIAVRPVVRAGRVVAFGRHGASFSPVPPAHSRAHLRGSHQEGAPDQIRRLDPPYRGSA